MRCKIENVALNFEIHCKIGNKDGKSGFEQVCIVLTTKYTQIQLLQRIFSWNGLKCQKKCCFCEERSEFILSQISEFLSDFAHFEVWFTTILAFLKIFGKSRFRAIWGSNMLHTPKMRQKFFWAIIAPAANMKPKMPKISIFPNLSKISIFKFSGFPYEQIPTESRKCCSFWNLSVL